MKPIALALLFSTSLSSSWLGAQSVAHWDFEKAPGTGGIYNLKAKTGDLELTQGDTFRRPFTSTNVPPTVNNRQSADLRRDDRQFLETISSPILNIGINAPFTLEAWINPRSYPDPNATVSSTIIQKRGGYGPEPRKPGYQLSINSAGKILFRAEGKDDGGKTLISNAIAPLDKWTHVAVTRDTSGLFSLYINGDVDLIAGGPRFAGSLENDSEFVIGANRFAQHHQFYFDGFLDEVRLSPVELHPAEFLLK